MSANCNLYGKAGEEVAKKEQADLENRRDEAMSAAKANAEQFLTAWNL